MTEEQKETLRFYTTNDYLLINGLLCGENEEYINAVNHPIYRHFLKAKFPSFIIYN